MINQKHVERLFDCLDQSATLIYSTYKMPYIEGLIKTCENIMAHAVEDQFESINSDLQSYIDDIIDIDFEKEEIRKAFQYACLKGFKHGQISNQMMTPETLGVFISYLINKLYHQPVSSIIDPVVGTGNLLTSIANQMKDSPRLIGVDVDPMFVQLASALFDMLAYGDQVFCQDTLTFHYPPVELLVGDLSTIDIDMVYKILRHHSQNLIEGGFMVAVVDQAVVDQARLLDEAKSMQGFWHLFGLVQLPQDLFKVGSKSLMMLQKPGAIVTKPTRFLWLELPSFQDQEAFKNVINQLNHWFSNTEFYKLGAEKI